MSSYDSLLDRIVSQLPTAPLSLVLIDGVPACGKSSLSTALVSRLLAVGRQAVVIENDWFMSASIRDPREIVNGLLLGVSRQPVEVVERRLLEQFLDGGRLGHFQDSLRRAMTTLAAGESATLRPLGAHWNLAHAPPWEERNYVLHPGAVLIIEGTLSRAVYLSHFPDAFCIFVEVPIPEARARFLKRNQSPSSRRNLAFSMLAWAGPAYRIAAEMIGRDRYPCHLRVDLRNLAEPQVMSR